MSVEGPIHAVASTVATLHRVPLREVLGESRFRLYARPRQIAMAIAAEIVPGASLPLIGRVFHRDHTTVIHARAVVGDRMLADPGFAASYERDRDACRRALLAGPGEFAARWLRADAERLAVTLAAAYRTALLDSAGRDPAGFVRWAKSGAPPGQQP